MPTNAEKFNLDLRRFAKERVPEDFAKLTKLAGLELLNGVVLKTPVDIGEHRGKWSVGLGGPGDDVTRVDPSGAETLRAGAATIETAQPFQNIHVTNHGPAIDVLENGGFVPSDPGPSKDPRPGRKGRILVRGGYSVQAPRGMAALTIQELRARFGS